MKPTPAQVDRWAKRKAKARAMKQQGLTLEAIGAKLRVTRQRVWQMLQP
jgi:DNA-directed RNA polymerase sigma subunit (sigma70/sigma32)